MITDAQSRMARAAVRWTVRDLAYKAEISPATVNRFEIGRAEANRATMAAIQRALEAAGVEFLPDNGVRLKGAQVTRRGRDVGENSASTLPSAGPDKVSHVGTPAPDQDAENGDLKGKPDQTAETAIRSTGSGSEVSGQLVQKPAAPKPRRPRAKPLLMSKEAQIRALRERDG